MERKTILKNTGKNKTEVPHSSCHSLAKLKRLLYSVLGFTTKENLENPKEFKDE